LKKKKIVWSSNERNRLPEKKKKIRGENKKKWVWTRVWKKGGYTP